MVTISLVTRMLVYNLFGYTIRRQLDASLLFTRQCSFVRADGRLTALHWGPIIAMASCFSSHSNVRCFIGHIIKSPSLMLDSSAPLHLVLLLASLVKSSLLVIHVLIITNGMVSCNWLFPSVKSSIASMIRWFICISISTQVFVFHTLLKLFDLIEEGFACHVDGEW